MGCTAVVALLRGGSKPEVPTTAGAAACVEIRHFQNQRELDPGAVEFGTLNIYPAQSSRLLACLS